MEPITTSPEMQAWGGQSSGTGAGCPQVGHSCPLRTLLLGRHQAPGAAQCPHPAAPLGQEAPAGAPQSPGLPHKGHMWVCAPPDGSAHLHHGERWWCYPLPRHPCACHACTPWAAHTACPPPSPETAPHSTASGAFIGARGQAVPPCPRLGHADPFLGTLPAPRAQAGQLQPGAARLCHSIQGSRMPGGLGVPIILSPFLAPGHPHRAMQPTVYLLPSPSPQPWAQPGQERGDPGAHPCDPQLLPAALSSHPSILGNQQIRMPWH